MQLLFFFALIAGSLAFDVNDVPVSEPTSVTNENITFNARLDQLIEDQKDKHEKEWMPLKIDDKECKFVKTVDLGLLKTNETGI